MTKKGDWNDYHGKLKITEDLSVDWASAFGKNK